MVTMAKGIGNGFPLAAVVTTREIGATMVIRSATTTKNSVKSHNSMNLCVFTEFFVLGTSSTFQHLWRKSSGLHCRNGCPRYHWRRWMPRNFKPNGNSFTQRISKFKERIWGAIMSTIIFYNVLSNSWVLNLSLFLVILKNISLFLRLLEMWEAKD